MPSLPAILKRDLQKQAPVFLYFFFTFNVLGLTRVLVLREHGIRVSTFLPATVGALLVSRVVLLAERLPFMTPFPPTPVLPNAAWQSLLYTLLALALMLLRDVLLSLHPFVRGPLAPASPAAVLLDRLTSPRFWAIQMWTFLLFLLFCTARSFFRAIGPPLARQTLLGSPRPHNVRPSPRAGEKPEPP